LKIAGRDFPWKWLHRLALAIACALLVDAGFQMRWWAWRASAHIHFSTDMQNALRWGNRADKLGYLNLYSLVLQSRDQYDLGLDYPPLRLAVFTLWAKWLDHAAPEMVPAIPVNELKIPTFLVDLEGRHWRSEYRVNRPLLMFNAAVELAASLAAGLLVWQTVHRPWLALIAAMCLWLNPGVWIDSWMRPSWDAWILPFYLWGILAAFRRRWMISGVIMGIGCMFKGQLLVVVPLFVLWPVFRADLLAALRWLGGFLLATAVIVSPWLLTRFSDDRRTLNWPPLGFVAGIVLLAVLLRRRLPRAWLQGAVAVLVAGAIFSGAFFSATALDWYRVGFKYGVQKYPNLEMGGTDCLAGILEHRYGFDSKDVCFTFTPHVASWSSSPVHVTISRLLMVVYASALVAATVGLVLQLHWGSSRWLVAATTPWLLFFTLAPHMHERYLVWAAGVGAIVVGDSFGMTLLLLLISAASGLMTLGVLLGGRGGQNFLPTASGALGPPLKRLIEGMSPDFGWALLLCAAVFLYQSLRFPTNRSSSPKGQT
jgi:hypothetical protein